jgi:hypothetical protein
MYMFFNRLALSPWYMMKEASRAYRLSFSRLLTMDDMPDFKTCATPPIISAYLHLAASEFFLRAALRDLLTTVPAPKNCYEIISFATRVVPNQFLERIITRFNKLESHFLPGTIQKLDRLMTSPDFDAK